MPTAKEKIESLHQRGENIFKNAMRQKSDEIFKKQKVASFKILKVHDIDGDMMIDIRLTVGIKLKEYHNISLRVGDTFDVEYPLVKVTIEHEQ